MNNNFTVCKANDIQRGYVLERVSFRKEQENAIIYVALDNTDKIIGRIIVIERDVPPPINGKRWYIDNLFVEPNFRRRGVATALVKKMKDVATSFGIIYLYGSANPSREATEFWFNCGFTLNAYGRKQEDESKPLYYGNYYHMISYRIERAGIGTIKSAERIRELNREEILNLINIHVENERRRNAYLSKADDFFGFAAIEDNGEVKGFILSFSDSMQSPLDSYRWFVFPYVYPRYRGQGIGRALVYHIQQHTRGKDAVQLTAFDEKEDDIGFWYKIGFDIFFWDENRQTGKRATTAMLRL